MRTRIQSAGTIGTVLLALGLSACDGLIGIDNYDAPTSQLTGRLVFNGTPVNLRSGGIELELWEPKYESRAKIPIYVAQDGTYSATIFDGDYRLNTINNSGPWLNRTDTVNVQVRGNAVVDLEVKPYYLVQDPQVTYSTAGGAGGTVTATFQIASPNAGRDLELVGLYVNTTTFVDRQVRTSVFERTRAQLPGTWQTQPVTLSVVLPANIRDTPSPAPREHVYVRVGIKSVGLTELIYSPLIKLAI